MPFDRMLAIVWRRPFGLYTPKVWSVPRFSPIRMMTCLMGDSVLRASAVLLPLASLLGVPVLAAAMTAAKAAAPARLSLLAILAVGRMFLSPRVVVPPERLNSPWVSFVKIRFPGTTPGAGLAR